MVTPVAGRSWSTAIVYPRTENTQRTSNAGTSVGMSHADRAARTINRPALSRGARRRRGLQELMIYAWLVFDGVADLKKHLKEQLKRTEKEWLKHRPNA